jgi:mannose/cellobiose epimerase-like protein (N-acyl-D-glucosamine 2-epimerase family)
LILAETSGRAAYLDRARALVELFFTRFRTGPHGFVCEYFTADWRPVPGHDGGRHEPGHQFEWIWILLRYARLAGDRDLPARVADLLSATIQHGIDRAPGQLAATFDEIDPSGAPLVTTKRLWPQTETVKAFVAAYEVFGDEAHLARAQDTIRMMLATYLPGGQPLFREHLDRSGRASVVDFVPTSSLYHLFLSLAEYLRIRTQAQATS